jgi:hypothetical protein
VRYDELLPDSGVVTVEDFIDPSAWTGALTAARAAWPSLPMIETEALSVAGDRLGIVGKECESAGIPKEERKKLLEAVKDQLFEGLRRAQIEERYYQALGELVRYLP